MKVHVIGGGPAGLYFSILMKKAWPQTRITVFERNRPDDTFGFGVVFSDQTLDTFESYDRESYRAIIGHFAYWDDIEIHFKDLVQRVGGNGFCGCSRMTLLTLLQQRAQASGITPDAARKQLMEKDGLRRIGQPEDVAEMALFLCTERARHIQGSAIAVDGGATIL